MKTNILTNMKEFAKYICAVVVMLGMSVSAWGETSITVTRSGSSVTSIDFGTITSPGSSSWTFDISVSCVTLGYYDEYSLIDVSGDDVFYDPDYATTYGYLYNATDQFKVGYNVTTPGTYNGTLTIGVYHNKDCGAHYDGEWYEETIPITITYTPSCSTSPTVTAGSYSAVRSTTATVSCSGGISSLGSAGCSISSYGFVIGTATGPAIGGSGVTKEQVGTSYATKDVGFSKDLTGLTANTKYYVRPYATNGNGTSYGTETSFTTLQRYAITYNKNDGSGASATEYKDHGISYTISSNKYSRSGYTLVKWHTLAAGTGGTDYAKGASYTSNANLSLHAVWGGTISYNNNGGSGSMDAAVVVSGGSYSLPSCTFTPPSGKKFKCWAQGTADGTERAVGYSHTVAGDITFYAVWRDEQYTDYKFSCADWSLTGPSGDIVFITSAASKTVRSQEAFHVTASGLPATTALTFTTFPANTRFAFKKADGSAIETDTYGKVNTDFYVFYTPTSGDTGDGLDELTSLTVSVTGEPRTATIDTKRIIGRHLPADFVIAAKYNKKWYALPATMSTGSTPEPDEIAVDDSHNPGIAYTSANNVYGLEGPSATNISGGNGQYVKLTMSQQLDGTGSNGPAPLYASSSANIGKNGTAGATSDLSAGWWWALTQTATDITNPQDAKYTIKSPNNSNTLRIKNNPFVWGLYASGVEELRLIPRSSLTFTEAVVVAWGKTNLIVEVDKPTVGATQVRGKLNGSYSTNKSLSTSTGTSVKGTSTRYNYTLSFADEFDFSAEAATDKTLLFEWLDAEGEILKVSSVVVPKIIASSSTMSSINNTKGYWKDLEVHVLPGVTLTANTASFSGAVTIRHMEIYPGATVQITTASAAGTLTVDSLILRNGWNRLTGEKSYDVARLYIQPYKSASEIAASLATTSTEASAYMDWYIDYDQYYPVAVPWTVTTSGMTYLNTSGAASAGVMMRYYDGASRAANVQSGVGSGANWKEYSVGGNAYPATLTPGQGYIMTARRPAGKAFSIVRMPLTIPDGWTTDGEQGYVSSTHKDQVSVTAHGDASTPSYAQGWNLIANPYMSLYEGALSYTDAGEIKFANIPNTEFTEYDQVVIETSKLKPSSAFLVQAPKTGTVTFGTASRVAAAPSYRRDATPKATEQKAYISLANDATNDMMGLLVSEDYTDAYEINADLQKLLGDGTSLRTYMHFGDLEMAYLAINEVSAKKWIPVSVRIPSDGEYTYSLHKASRIDELEGIYLQDYNTGQIINLIEENYTFTAEAGTIHNRFAINAAKGSRETPTDIDILQISGGQDMSKPIKFLYRDKVFILYGNELYDATGKRVKTINK